MSDSLDQSDIDSLLSALDSGEVVEQDHTDQIFSRRLGNDLVQLQVRAYDFKRPERVSKDQMRSLETLHEGFARNFGASLSAFLRMIVEVKISNCEQLTYGEFTSSLPNPTSFNLLHARPLEGAMCLEISPLIIYPIIDRLLGGNNQELFIPQRPLTVIENRLVAKLIDRAMLAMREAWSGVGELDFELGESESNPQLVQIVPPNEVVVVICFEIKLQNRAGTINLCIPYKVIEPLMDKLSAQSWFHGGQLRKTEALTKKITGNLSRATVDVTGLLAETTLTMGDLLRLEPGDLILTEKPASENIAICVEGEKKFLALMGQHKGNRAMRVDRAYEPTDHV